MTMNDQENGYSRDAAPLDPAPTPKHAKQKCSCRVCMCLCLIVVLTVLLVILILSLTMFKVKQPKLELVSTTVEGIAPRFTFPTMKVELNITLNLTILVSNPNHVSFKAGLGEAQLLYKGDQVGNVDVNPGLIPSRGSATLACLLTLEADRFADSGVMPFIQDIMDGELELEVKTRVPGRAKVLFFRKHVVTTSDCQIVIGFPDMEIKKQDCKQHTKL